MAIRFQMHLSYPWFDLVKDGLKTWEGRRLTDKTRGIRVGDRIQFTRVDETDSPFDVDVVEIRFFPTFEFALKELGLGEVLPGVETLEEGVQIYQQYVSLSTQEAEGVIMIKMSRI